MERHAARPRPWLVVDNNSSSESATPRSRAKRSNGKCHLPGTPSRVRHMDTADLLAPSISATAPVPPNKSMMSEAVLVDLIPDNISQNVRVRKTEHSHFVNSARQNGADFTAGVTEYQIMGQPKTWKYNGKEALARIKHVLSVRCKLDPDQHGYGKLAAAELEIAQSTLTMWATRGAPVSKLPDIAMKYDVDIYYLLGKNDEMGRFGGPAIEAVETDLQSQIDIIASRLNSLEEAS